MAIFTCKNMHVDCFAFDEATGFCKALKDTMHFKHDCPFYKSRDRVIKEDPEFFRDDAYED